MIMNAFNINNYPLSKKIIISRAMYAPYYSVMIVLLLTFITVIQPYRYQVYLHMYNILPAFIRDEDRLTLIIEIAVISFLCACIYQYFYFKTYYFSLDATNVTIKKGLMTRTQIMIPYERIQEVSLQQNFINRLLGIYTLNFNSAAYYSKKASCIEGLQKQAADTLHQFAAQQIRNKKNNAGVN